jgi:hypothetical protein
MNEQYEASVFYLNIARWVTMMKLAVRLPEMAAKRYQDDDFNGNGAFSKKQIYCCHG